MVYTDHSDFTKRGIGRKLERQLHLRPLFYFQGSLAGGRYFPESAPLVADLDGDNKPEVVFVTQGPEVCLPVLPVFISIITKVFATATDHCTQHQQRSERRNRFTLSGNYLNTHNDTPQVLSDGNCCGHIPACFNTSLQLTVPTGFDDNRIAATFHGLTAFFTHSILYTTQWRCRRSNKQQYLRHQHRLLIIHYYPPDDGLAIADFDKDGKPDIAVNDNGQGKIYANTLSAPGASVVSGTFTVSASTLTSGSHT